MKLNELKTRLNTETTKLEFGEFGLSTDLNTDIKVLYVRMNADLTDEEGDPKRESLSLGMVMWSDTKHKFVVMNSLGKDRYFKHIDSVVEFLYERANTTVLAYKRQWEMGVL